MLNIVSRTSNRMCDGFSRRDFLRIGTLGLGAGYSLANLFQTSASAKDSRAYLKDKSVVLLFLAGGPSQYETFDPKPGGLEGFTSINGHVQTSVPGVHFSAYLPKLAKLADRLSVVRSFKTNHAEHSGAAKQFLTADLTVQDGKPIVEPGLGAMYARIAGPINSKTGMIQHVAIPPTLRYLPQRAGFAGSFEAVTEGLQGAWLGASTSPLQLLVKMAEGEAKVETKKGQPEAVNPLLDNLQAHLPMNDLTDRLDLLKQLDGFNRVADTTGGMDAIDAYNRMAIDVLRSDRVRKALDLSLESNRTLQAYDTEHFRNWNADENSKFLRNGPSIGFSLGRQMLLARRLAESGCGFVTVVSSNWDFHARKNIPNMPEGMSAFGPPVDHAVSAFLEDIEQRGLSDKILLVVTGEFGRSGLDKNAGRHHHPKICPLVFAGGGLKHGQVIGRSNARGSEPDSDPYVIDDLHATILNTMMDVSQLRLDDSIPPKLVDRAQRGRVISELF